MNAREEWLQQRRAGVGGSDIAALLGLSPYKTPMQLWLDKTGRADDAQPDGDAAERMHFGQVLEQVVAQEYSQRTGAKVQRILSQLQHPECPIALANIDRALVTPGSKARWDPVSRRVLGADGVLECKTAHAMALHSAEWGDAGTADVPQAYWMQVQWYLGITGLQRGDLAVLFGGQKFRTYTIAADTALFADLLTEADRWWRAHVVADVPPQPSTEDEARQLWRSHVAGRDRIVDVLVADAVQQLAETKEQIRALEQEEQELRDTITCAFADAESISYMGRRLATWKANRAGAKTDWKSVAYDAGASAAQIAAHTTTTEGARVLRLITPKEL